MPINISDVPISKDAYLNFDGRSLKDAITRRLSEGGVFTDQNYEGSNISHWNEIVSYAFSMLLFYLNKQSNEGIITESQIYENMNRVVKRLDYRPIGYQTATLGFLASVQGINKGVYTIPRYSYIEAGGISYSFKDDISFVKIEHQISETLTDMSNSNLLFQGKFIEHPLLKPQGNENEILFLTVNDETMIDHFTIDVYVKESELGKWFKYEKVDSLYLNNSNDRVYELRYNENKRYEIKFGNDINGKKLSSTDDVAIYYLASEGSIGEVGANVLTGKTLTKYSTSRHAAILEDTADNFTILSNFNSLSFVNNCKSSKFGEPETVDEIRENAPAIFRSQYRVVTQNDYTNFIKTNFKHLIDDVKVFNNSQYLEYYIKYFTNLGLMNSNMESRALFNQVNWADACNFNNVYAFVIPKTVGNFLSYVNPSQKSLILDSIKAKKVLTSELILMDPVYLAFDLALSDVALTLTDRDYTKLVIVKNPISRRNDDNILNSVVEEILTFFNRGNNSLGQIIDINQLNVNIMSIDGVKNIYTKRIDIGLQVEGLRFMCWNPAYGDISISSVISNIKLEDFQFPYLTNDVDFSNRIEIESSKSKFEGVEY